MRGLTARPRDTLGNPFLHFLVKPADGPRADLDTAWKTPFGLELIDHLPAEAGHLTDLREPQDLHDLP